MGGTGRGRDGNDRAIGVLAEKVLYKHDVRRRLCDHRPTTPLSGHVTRGASSLIPPVAGSPAVYEGHGLIFWI